MIDINTDKLFILVLTSTLASCAMKISTINNPNSYALATTLLCISALAKENLLIEIEFTAKIRKQ